MFVILRTLTALVLLATALPAVAEVTSVGENGFAVSHTVSAAADADHLRMGATAFLRWKVLESLSALGYKANDLTDAALNPVTHFKSQLGGNLETCLVFERVTCGFSPREIDLAPWKSSKALVICFKYFFFCES